MGKGNTTPSKPPGLSRRRFIAAASAASVGTLAVSGCLSEAADENTIVVSGDTDFEGIVHSDGDEPSLQQALWDAGLDEDLRIEVRPGPDDTVDRRSTYEMGLQAGRSPPDIFMMDNGWTIPFILREQTLPLDGLLPDDVLERIDEEYLDVTLETARHPETDELHALPLFPDFPSMLYRKDLVEDAGYDPEGEEWATNPLSWEAFSEVTATTLEESGVDFGFTTQAAAFEGLACCTFNETMTSWGGAYFGGEENLFTAGDRPITVEDENVLEAIRMMRAFITGDDADAAGEFHQICPSAIVQWSEEESLGPFQNENAVMHRNWPYAIAETGGDDVFGDDLGVMPIPYGVTEDDAEYEGTGGTAAGLGGWNLVVNPNSEKRAQALEVLEAFTHDNVMLTMFELLGWLPPNLDLLEDVDPDDGGPVARYVEPLQVAGENAIPRPVTDVWPEQSALIFQEVHSAYRGVKSPERAMSDLHDRLERSERDVEETAVEGGDDGS